MLFAKSHPGIESLRSAFSAMHKSQAGPLLCSFEERACRPDSNAPHAGAAITRSSPASGGSWGRRCSCRAPAGRGC